MFAAARRVNLDQNSSKTLSVTAQTIWRQQHASSCFAAGEEVYVGKKKRRSSRSTPPVSTERSTSSAGSQRSGSQPRESLAASLSSLGRAGRA